MKHFPTSAFAGASALALIAANAAAFAPERKDTATLPAEIKGAFDKFGETFETFKTKNDARLQQLEKRGEDAVTKAEVEKLNTGLDELKASIDKQLDEVVKKANRAGLSGGGAEAAAEAKAAALFGEMVARPDFKPEELKTYRGELAHYLRRNEAKAGLMVGSDPSGGYLVTPDTTGRMVKKVYETSPMRQLATVVTIGTDALEGPIDNGEVDAAWVGETQTRTETGTPQLGMWRIEANELYAYPKATQKLLEDASIDIEAWLGDKASAKFGRKENTAFVVGDGSKKPRGLFSYPVVATGDATRAWGSFQYVPGGHASLLNSADALLNLIFEGKAPYRQMARFMGSRQTMREIRKLKDGQGNYLVGLRLADNALVETVFGFSYVDGEDAPQVAANAYPLAFGDFAETYTIVDRLGITVIRDNITAPGFVKWNMRKRTGGGAINFESMKFLKIATS